MRIIAGIKKGFTIKRVLSDKTRETSDMVRSAVFNMLVDIEKRSVLDLFSGSGAYGLEAFSRGASHVTFVDHQKKAIETIDENIKKVGIENYLVIHSDYQVFLKKMPNHFYDLIFLDPPYDLNIYEEVLKSLANKVNVHTYVVCEMDKKQALSDQISSFQKIKEKTYGIKKIIIYEKYE